MVKTVRILAFFCALTLSACSVSIVPDFHAYAGAKRSSVEVVKITIDSGRNNAARAGFNEAVAITKVDGKAANAYSVYVLPGLHSLEVYYSAAGMYAYGELAVDVVAGKEYIIKNGVYARNVEFKIEEISSTDEVEKGQ